MGNLPVGIPVLSFGVPLLPTLAYRGQSGTKKRSESPFAWFSLPKSQELR